MLGFEQVPALQKMGRKAESFAPAQELTRRDWEDLDILRSNAIFIVGNNHFREFTETLRLLKRETTRFDNDAAAHAALA